MGSVPQIGLGILILGAAFVFGHYIQQTNQSVNVAKNAGQTGESIQWQMSDQMDQLNSQLQQHANREQRTSDALDARPGDTSVKQPPSTSAFGSHISSKTSAVGSNSSVSVSQDPAATEGPPRDQRTLIDLLPPLSHNPAKPTRENQTTTRRPASGIADKIVPPDFSKLEHQSPADFEVAGTAPPVLEQTPVEQILGSRVIASSPPKAPSNGKECADCVQPSTPVAGNQPWLGGDFGPLQEVTRQRPNTWPPRDQVVRKTEVRREPIRDTGPSAETVPDINLQTPNSRPSESVYGRMTRVRSRQTRSVTLKTNEFRQHTTKDGETLQQVSQQYYGTPRYYLDIYLANQDVLDNPGSVNRGTVLRIPSYRQ